LLLFFCTNNFVFRKDIALHSIYFNRNNLAENSTEQNQEGDSPTISKSKDLLGYKKLGTTFDKLTYGYLNKQGQQRKNWYSILQKNNI
jgi:hypothetical protein